MRAKGDAAAAGRAVEELYRENPAILGVVRATVDFYWRNRCPLRRSGRWSKPRAPRTLPCAGASRWKRRTKRPNRETLRARRELATTLIGQEPLNAETISAMANVYARQGDDRGLRAFYEEKIGALRGDRLAPAERTSRIAELRRSLLPVLTRQKDYAAAMDQYIEILKSYPEDDELVREAGPCIAAAHTGRERLRGYFAKASADSPRDFRWPMVLARIETFLRDCPRPIAAYSHAIAIRPDRTDLRIARASLEERLIARRRAGELRQL